MIYYDSLLEALTDLQLRGYTQNFSLHTDCVRCQSIGLQLKPEEFTLDEYYRFEDDSSADNNSIVFAISSRDGVRGTIVDAYGVYAENLNAGMVERLTISGRS